MLDALRFEDTLDEKVDLEGVYIVVKAGSSCADVGLWYSSASGCLSWEGLWKDSSDAAVHGASLEDSELLEVDAELECDGSCCCSSSDSEHAGTGISSGERLEAVGDFEGDFGRAASTQS